MFTGLIEDVGECVGLKRLGRAAKLSVRTGLPIAEIATGDSVAVNGACLTVESADAGTGIVTFHTLNETLQRTNLEKLTSGVLVNLERAMCLGTRIGGHLVSGHVDATSRIITIAHHDDDIEVSVALPDFLSAQVILKGSIAINGISLTIAALGSDRFSVRIIPHTWAATNLRTAATGTEVNLETDLIGKYVLRYQEAAGGNSSVTMSSLSGAGFL